MSIDAGAQVAIILFSIRPCVVILNSLGHVLYLGRAPRTRETLLDFHKWCRVTRHPRVFCGLTVCQRTPRDWGVTVTAQKGQVSHGAMLLRSPVAQFVERNSSKRPSSHGAM